MVKNATAAGVDSLRVNDGRVQEIQSTGFGGMERASWPRLRNPRMASEPQ